MTLREVWRTAASELTRINQVNPEQEAWWIIQAAIKPPPPNIVTVADRPLAAGEYQEIQKSVQRRLQREPLQYIIGTVDFYHLTLHIDARALIPRPETEGLVELGSRFIQQIPHPRVLDVGTGSGAILLSLLALHQTATGIGCDLSAPALDLAQENGVLLALDSRVHWVAADLLADNFIHLINNRFDLVISNPPYVSIEDYDDLPPEIREYEPALALKAGKEGLTFIERLAQIGQELITEYGVLVCEIGEKQAEAAQSYFQRLKWRVEVKEDLSGKSRYLKALRQ